MGTFSFISPLLTERSGIPLGLVPLVFVCFGVGSMIGPNGIGRFADRRPVAALIGCALAAGLVLLLLIPLSANPVTAVIVITLLGAVSMAIPTAATGLSVRLAHSAPTLAAAFTVSAFNGGVAAGSSLGGRALDTSLGQTGPATLGVVMVALGLIPLAAVAIKRASRPNTAKANPPPLSRGASSACVTRPSPEGSPTAVLRRRVGGTAGARIKRASHNVSARAWLKALRGPRQPAAGSSDD
jgi:DHA1 family inner membrane transport protein